MQDGAATVNTHVEAIRSVNFVVASVGAERRG
jgi:hypothetical protein